MKNYKYRAGVTLLELIVAMGILTIASTSVLAMLFSSVQANANAHRITVATFNAQQGVEEFVGRQWLDVDGIAGLNRFPWGTAQLVDHANNIPLHMVASVHATRMVLVNGQLEPMTYSYRMMPGQSIATGTRVANPTNTPLPYGLVKVFVAIFETEADANSFIQASITGQGTPGRRLAHHAHIIDVGYETPPSPPGPPPGLEVPPVSPPSPPDDTEEEEGP